MLNYCGIAFVKTASGLLVPKSTIDAIEQRFIEEQRFKVAGYQSKYDKMLDEKIDMDDDERESDWVKRQAEITMEGFRRHPKFTDIEDLCDRINEHGNGWSARIVGCDKPYLSDFITDGPLSDSTAEDFLDA